MKKINFCIAAASACIAILPATAVADSNKVKWDGNGHFYQRIDNPLTWHDARDYCKSKSAHLATITSTEENVFIADTLLAPVRQYSTYYFLGATDEASQYSWKWITGEKWNYQNWYSGDPDNRAGEDYLVINAYYDYQWLDAFASGSDIVGFICEWSNHNFIGTASVPDINGNGKDEIAGLYVDYQSSKHTVKIKDEASGALLSTLTFRTRDAPPQGIVALDDLNGNGIPEIGVLSFNPVTRLSEVQIKDAKNNNAVLKTISFLTAYHQPKDASVSPDENGNGYPEITVLGVHKSTGKATSEKRDSKTGNVLGSVTF